MITWTEREASDAGSGEAYTGGRYIAGNVVRGSIIYANSFSEGTRIYNHYRRDYRYDYFRDVAAGVGVKKDQK
jgi:hypothetical protein